ncbi:MAG: PEP-CTERM sorting domain-containing protein [Burkholderiales bacterium]
MHRIAKGLAVTAALAAIQAHATVLTFDGNICDGPGNSCTNGRDILQSYGDQPGALDVTYERNLDIPGTAPLSFWNTQYSNLVNVAFGAGISGTGAAEIFLNPEPGYTVTLNGLALGAWPSQNRMSQLTILGGDGTSLFASGPITVLGATASSFGFALTHPDGIRIQWGPNAYYVGIDNIDFTLEGLLAIPEPSALALLAIGVAVLAWGTRRRS